MFGSWQTGHSGGNRAGFSPASLVTHLGTRDGNRYSLEHQLNSHVIKFSKTRLVLEGRYSIPRACGRQVINARIKKQIYGPVKKICPRDDARVAVCLLVRELCAARVC